MRSKAIARIWSISLALIALVGSSCASTATTIASASDVIDPTTQRKPLVDDSNPFADTVAGGGIDFRLTRDDVICSQTQLNVDPEVPFLLAHYVVDGNLGAPCFGEPDPRLTRAWQLLVQITPPGQLHDLSVFSGFVSRQDNWTTYAFVLQRDASGDAFEMAVNMTQADLDRDRLMLTMAHEMAHVIAGQPDQINWRTRPDRCDTWHDGFGCFESDSYMWAWIDEFWDEGRIEQASIERDPGSTEGADRCALDPSFLGSYAASHPEEDFAVSFSAFVMQLELPSSQLDEKMVWFAQYPELAEYRNQAVEAQLGPLRNNYAPCGGGSR